ncbi:MAG TPA: DUF3105 domain-containing protein [Solirubrobacterales bacterium]
MREQRQSSRAKLAQRRLVLAYAGAGLIGLVVVVGIVVLIASSGGGGGGDTADSHVDQGSGSTNGIEPDDRTGIPPPPTKVRNLKVAAKKAGCNLRLHLKDEGHTHIPPGSPAPHYGTNPPTSGNHVEPPYQQADGAYAEMPAEIDFVHSIEHGRMEIQYSPELPEKQQLDLKGLYDTMYGGTLLFPNENMPYEVAAVTWTNLLGCKEYKGSTTDDAIRAFGKATWGRYGGEPVNGFALAAGPTPIEPAEPG